MALDQEIAALRQELISLKALVLSPKKPVEILRVNAREIALSGYSESANIVLCFIDASEVPLSLALPDARMDKNALFVLIKTDSTANAVTLNPVAGQTISGAASKALAAQYDTITLMSDRSNWFLTSELS